jgi:DNA-binding transcriptional regulator LsrR (DeoR family)
MASKQEHLILLAEVAMLYYEKKMTQNEIAAILDVSRSTVSRLLEEALREKVVEITINYPWQSSTELEARLEERFHLETARVLIADYKDNQQMLEGLGSLAARYLTSILRDDTSIGVSFGQAIYHTIKALRVEPSAQRKIIQIGGAGNFEDFAVDAVGLVQFLANTIGGTCYYLHVPMIVESETVRDALMHEPTVRETLDLARQADIILLGIGATGPELVAVNPAYQEVAVPVEKAEPGCALGAICGQLFDINGDILNISINKRAVGLELESLKQNKRVIAIAGGQFKALAILGALRGRYVDVIITDEKAAKEVLLLDRHINPT